MNLIKSLPLLLLAVSSNNIAAFPHFATKIPNGYAVPNPGPQGGYYAGVGHINPAGDGERNSFGLDFARFNFTWVPELCQLDSDGDGRTNGQELGDPDCIWKEGDVPRITPAPSHPGIVDEDTLASISDTTNGGGLHNTMDCSDYVPPDDELSLDIQFSAPTLMDETRTHYICEQMTLEVPETHQSMLHQIKTSVILDNADVLHHMFVYICDGADNDGDSNAYGTGGVSTDGDRVGEGFYPCSGNESGCRRMGGWAIGPHDSCGPPNVGTERNFKGKSSIVVKIEAHYDNTSGQPQQDQSGIRLFMTPTLRPIVGMTSTLGMPQLNPDLTIPAQEPNYQLTNVCPSAVSEHLQHPVYVYAFTPHMHLFGKQLVTEHYRCGRKIGEIGRIDAYEFDNQQTYALNPPVKILPGDDLITTCAYDTTTSDVAITGGEASTDEMCLNFLGIYPKPTQTPDIPGFMSICFSFENGMYLQGRKVGLRFAIGDAARKTLTRNFVSDPTVKNEDDGLLECCSATAEMSCEELFLAEMDEPCGANADCVEGLVCAGGLCAPPPLVDTSSSISEVGSGVAGGGMQMPLLLMSWGLIGLCLFL